MGRTIILSDRSSIVVVISAHSEWTIACEILRPPVRQTSPYGEWFEHSVDVGDDTRSVIFCEGGYGKISAAGSAQFILDRWNPDLVVNLGTCGGFAGRIGKGTIILVERTIVYDIIEQMTGAEAAIEHFSTVIDLSFLREPYPHPVERRVHVSADRDLVANEVETLFERYGAVAGDWESGAIAWVTARNGVPCLILRGVSDLVSDAGGEAYDDLSTFEEGAKVVMRGLLEHLGGWIECAERG